MYDLKVYLAGKMSGLSIEESDGWRRKIKSYLETAAHECDCKIKVIDPIDYYNYQEVKHQSEKEIEDFDLMHVVTSNIIVVNLEGLNTSDGTKLEIFEACRNFGIPVIAFGDKKLYEQLHPWIKNKITRVESNMIEVCDYIHDFYMI